jgi:hypothetical protein
LGRWGGGEREGRKEREREKWVVMKKLEKMGEGVFRQKCFQSSALFFSRFS